MIEPSPSPAAEPAWLAAALRPDVDAAIRAAHVLIERATAARRPRCDVSGRCCRFEQWGHRLYVTGLEAAWFLHQAAARKGADPASGVHLGIRSNGNPDSPGTPDPPITTDSPTTVGILSAPRSNAPLSTPDIDAALKRGECPFLACGRCSVHAIRPMGCRVYFCDPTVQQWQQDLFERAHRMIADLHAGRSIPYEFAEWRSLLRRLVIAAPELAARVSLPGVAPHDAAPSFVQVGRS